MSETREEAVAQLEGLRERLTNEDEAWSVNLDADAAWPNVEWEANDLWALVSYETDRWSVQVHGPGDRFSWVYHTSFGAVGEWLEARS